MTASASDTVGRQGIVVQKYGGSSVADIDRLKLVARRVADTAGRGHPVVVVVSAMGRTTDELMELACAAVSRPPRRELDMLLSAGERIASALLAMALIDLGQDAVSFTGSQCGIITNHRHTDARIVEVRPYRVQDELDLGRVVIIAGYQGVSYKREVTTLGRGGTDTTAVAMAAALGAELCEICSDVDGVYSGDPRHVASPRHLPQLSYDEMAELAHYGAKVLNAEAVEFARQNGIVIHARATAGSDRVTRVSAVPSGRAVVGVTCQRGLVCVRGHGGPAQLAAMGQVLERQDLSPFSVRLEHGHPSLVLVREQCHDYGALLAELDQTPGGVDLHEDLDAVSVVGQGLGDDPSRLGVLLRLADTARLPVEGVDANRNRMTLLVGEGTVDRAVEIMHRAFVEEAPDPQ